MESPNANSNLSEYQPDENEAILHTGVEIDALAMSLSTMLAIIITDFDSKSQDTLKSQDYLNSTIDRLTQELDQLLEDAPLPFIMQNAAKISAVRKRVSSLTFVLDIYTAENL